ncbi:MAG: TldD/PmbA family protein [Theionarchaea archaeon]|nr:TldD/PmbA family protein [Theionarchaea archaeon]MBU7001975.1 TldD/PmbA family protein [Theionarchaea archaeon]MBU7019774.1 TldD/PmbA family protein [Theionarchaea archaeon]MBU7034606.1 TldD/PmbA family protein [Theionarchaea archaeon]MBU7041304.1 TldD/PmbA family protein [Theionarchaea archaeon]
MKEEYLSIVERAVKTSNADQCEARLSGMSWGLTRFANNYIHQNVVEDNAELTVRSVFGKKIGKAQTNQLDPESIAEVVRRADGIARVQTEIPDFVSLPAPESIPSVKGFYKETAEVEPEARALVVKAAVDQAETLGIESVSGTHYTGKEEIAVANSLGIEAYFEGTVSCFKINTCLEQGTGTAQSFSRNHRDLNPEALTEKACQKALKSRKTEPASPGSYQVILEEQAVCEMLVYLAMMTFGAQPYLEGRSAFSGHLGDQVADSSVSLWDDGLDERGFPFPFDAEGVPKQRVNLIERGLAGNVVYDSFYAAKAGTQNTGHSVDMPFGAGPFSANVFMGEGTSSLEDLISECENAILVTRFHYINPMHRLKTVITGMTRDGTFLVKNGEIVRGLKNMRFTQSVLDALSTVQGIGNNLGILRMEYAKATVCAPALRIGEFTFTGSTLF